MAYEDLFSILESCQRSIFRLEALPAYDIPEEAEDFANWKRGASEPDHTQRTEWQAMCRQLTGRGVNISRVRILQAPLTDYLRFEMTWWYPHNALAGEEILGLDIERHSVDLSVGEFYRIDNTIVRLNYDDEYRFVGWDAIDNGKIDPYLITEKQALSVAEPLSSAYERLSKSELRGAEWRLSKA